MDQPQDTVGTAASVFFRWLKFEMLEPVTLKKDKGGNRPEREYVIDGPHNFKLRFKVVGTANKVQFTLISLNTSGLPGGISRFRNLDDRIRNWVGEANNGKH